jgi:hypothetical protein
MPSECGLWCWERALRCVRLRVHHDGFATHGSVLLPALAGMLQRMFGEDFIERGDGRIDVLRSRM